MVLSSEPSTEGLKALYERLVQTLGDSSDGRDRTAVDEALARVQGCLDATLRQGGLPRDLRERFSFSVWLPRILQAADDAGVDDEPGRSNLARSLGERLIKLHTLADLMGEEEDLPDLRDHLVFAYVEAKSEWQQLNGIVNYGMARGRAPSAETLARAVLVSTIIADLDDLFGTENIDVLTDYLFAPLPNAHELTLRRHAFSPA